MEGSVKARALQFQRFTRLNRGLHALMIVSFISLALTGMCLRQLATVFVQLQQVVDGGHQLAVIPGLGQVIRRAGLDQIHRGFQMRPCGQQDHRQIRMGLPDLPEQGHALFAGGGVGDEVHVLDHQIHRLARQQRQPELHPHTRRRWPW